MFNEKRNQQRLFFDFFFSIHDNTIEKKKTTKIVFRFFFFSFKIKILEKKKTTKVVFRFFFSFENATSENDIIKRMMSDNDDDNVVNCEFAHDASSIRSESYSSFVTLIQFLFINSLLVDTSLTRCVSRFSIVELTTRRASFKIKLRRAQRRIHFNNWTSWFRANFFSFDSHNALIRRSVFS
jgi:hypothetical protein